MVHQHSSLIPTFTVLENLMLGQGEGVRLSVKKAQDGLARLSAVLGVEVDGHTEVAQLSLGQQQQVEIIKALWQGSKVLILDEPTSMLTPKGIDDLQRVIVQLKQKGLPSSSSPTSCARLLPSAIASRCCVRVAWKAPSTARRCKLSRRTSCSAWS
jgi:ABC-type sugar transport system ATPase subunit